MTQRKGQRGDLRVAVIMGGQSAERDVSVNMGTTVTLELSGRFPVKPVLILASGQWVVPRGFLGNGVSSDPQNWFQEKETSLLRGIEQLREEGVQVVFNGLHGPLGEDGTVQGLFRMVEIPLTGPDVIPAAVTMDKRFTKQVLQAGGISTPRFFTLPATALLGAEAEWWPRMQAETRRVPLPWILKPNRLGSSVGVALFRDLKEVRREAATLVRQWPPLALGDSLLVEEIVEGRELTCGVLESRGPAKALLPIEIRPRTSTFFDYHAKYEPGASEEICPAPLSEEQTRRVQETALAVHSLLECAPLSRTDMFLTPDDRLQVLEVNTLPGMTATSLIPLSAAKGGMPLDELLSQLVEHALERAELPVTARKDLTKADG